MAVVKAFSYGSDSKIISNELKKMELIILLLPT